MEYFDVRGLTLTSTPTSSANMLKNFNLLLSYEGKLPAKLVYFLLVTVLFSRCCHKRVR